jgi:hypothetical protein
MGGLNYFHEHIINHTHWHIRSAIQVGTPPEVVFSLCQLNSRLGAVNGIPFQTSPPITPPWPTNKQLEV